MDVKDKNDDDCVGVDVLAEDEGADWSVFNNTIKYIINIKSIFTALTNVLTVTILPSNLAVFGKKSIPE